MAGLSHAALYKYFSSKAEMYAATFNDASTALTERFDLAIAEHSDFKSRISAILRECANIAEADPDSSTEFFSRVVTGYINHAGQGVGAKAGALGAALYFHLLGIQ